MLPLRNLRPGGRHGIATTETRDPIGYAVAGLNRLARSRRARPAADPPADRARGVHADPRRLQAPRPGRAGVRPGRQPRSAGVQRADRAGARGVFDLTPTEDEQMLVDVVERAAPARCSARRPQRPTRPVPHRWRCWRRRTRVGLPMLGVPESLGGITSERAVVAGALVAEALARGDLGLAVAALAPGAVATALATCGAVTSSSRPTCPPSPTPEAGIPAAALALTEPRPLFDALDLQTIAVRDGDG
ncbi:MAG: acyl-CoA dehydrogenase family protein [Nocardioides sp.]